MADELVYRLAAQIKAKEEKSALATKAQLHKVDFIHANCPMFFKQLSDELRASVDGLNSALAGNASADPPAQHCVDLPRGIIIVSKEDFPSAHAELGLNADGLMLTYALKASERKQTLHHEFSGFWRFDVDAENNLFLLGQKTSESSATPKPLTPKEVCDFVMVRIFSV